MMTSDMILKLINQNAVIRSDKWQGFVKYTPYKGTTQPSSSLKKESKKEKLVAQEAAASDAVSSPDPVTPVTPSAPDSSPATRAINKSKPKGMTAELVSYINDELRSTCRLVKMSFTFSVFSTLLYL